MLINRLDDLIPLTKKKKNQKLVVACAEDREVLEAVYLACKNTIVSPLLTGNKSKIMAISNAIKFSLSSIEIIDIPDQDAAIKEAINQIKTGNGNILMKGLVSTSKLLKAVLDKETGLRESSLLSHFALFQSPYYHKLFGVTDAAINISPMVEEKKIIIQNAIGLLHKLGNHNPKVAIVCPIEKVNPKISSTLDAEQLKKICENGLLTGCIVDGPLALDNAILKKAALQKGIKSDVAGDADLLVPSDLDASNILYKAINFLGGGTCAAVVLGAKVPIVLTSRADDEKTKLLSIALSVIL